MRGRSERAAESLVEEGLLEFIEGREFALVDILQARCRRNQFTKRSCQLPLNFKFPWEADRQRRKIRSRNLRLRRSSDR